MEIEMSELYFLYQIFWCKSLGYNYTDAGDGKYYPEKYVSFDEFLDKQMYNLGLIKDLVDKRVELMDYYDKNH